MEKSVVSHRKSLAFYKVLSVYLQHPAGEFTGSAVIKHTALQSGIVYPLLLRLVEYGWLTARWEDIDPESNERPPRRLYSMTEPGLVEAEKIKQAEGVLFSGFM